MCLWKLETLFLDRLIDHSLIKRLIPFLRVESGVTIIPATQELFESGFALFSQRMDKDWSLTDCISFVAMRQRGITDVLTGDRHFEQAGFKVLLK